MPGQSCLEKDESQKGRISYTRFLWMNCVWRLSVLCKMLSRMIKRTYIYTYIYYLISYTEEKASSLLGQSFPGLRQRPWNFWRASFLCPGERLRWNKSAKIGQQKHSRSLLLLQLCLSTPQAHARPRQLDVPCQMAICWVCYVLQCLITLSKYLGNNIESLSQIMNNYSTIDNKSCGRLIISLYTYMIVWTPDITRPSPPLSLIRRCTPWPRWPRHQRFWMPPNKLRRQPRFSLGSMGRKSPWPASVHTELLCEGTLRTCSAHAHMHTRLRYILYLSHVFLEHSPKLYFTYPRV